MTGISRRLATFAADLRYQDLPGEVVERTNSVHAVMALSQIRGG